MKIEIIKCDNCGSDGAKTMWLTIGRSMNPAGSMEDDVDSVDLCIDCAINKLAYTISNSMLYSDRQVFLNNLKKKKC